MPSRRIELWPSNVDGMLVIAPDGVILLANPVLADHREQSVLRNRPAGAGGGIQVASAVNATVITLDEAPTGYEDFDKGAAKKYVLNQHGLIKT